MTNVEQKVAVITGASQGIGAALVQAYRRHGWAAVAGDIADPATGRNVIDIAAREFGRVDTLVNNAGIFIAKPFLTTPPRTTGPCSGSTCACRKPHPRPVNPWFQRPWPPWADLGHADR